MRKLWIKDFWQEPNSFKVEIMVGEKNGKCHKPGPSFSNVSWLFHFTLKTLPMHKFLKSSLMALTMETSHNFTLLEMRSPQAHHLSNPTKNSLFCQYLFVLRTQLHYDFLWENISLTPTFYMLLFPVTHHTYQNALQISYFQPFSPITILSKNVMLIFKKFSASFTLLSI